MYVLRNTYYVLKGKQTESDMLKIRKFRIDPFYWLKIASLSSKQGLIIVLLLILFFILSFILDGLKKTLSR